MGPAVQTTTLWRSPSFDGAIDTFEARGHVQPSAWLTVTGGYEFERERYAERQDDNAVVARLRTTTDISQTAQALFGAAQVSALDRRLQVAIAGRLQTFRSGTPTRGDGAGTPHDIDLLAAAGGDRDSRGLPYPGDGTKAAHPSSAPISRRVDSFSRRFFAIRHLVDVLLGLGYPRCARIGIAHSTPRGPTLANGACRWRFGVRHRRAVA